MLINLQPLLSRSESPSLLPPISVNSILPIGIQLTQMIFPPPSTTNTTFPKGKTHLLNAFRTYAESIGLSDNLRFSATTGAAAGLIGATTWHGALQMNKFNRRPTTVDRRMAATYCLVVDEVSMLGQRVLGVGARHARILRGAAVTDDTPDPFGGEQTLFLWPCPQTSPQTLALFSRCVQICSSLDAAS
jgi:hypothetical protein